MNRGYGYDAPYPASAPVPYEQDDNDSPTDVTAARASRWVPPVLVDVPGQGFPVPVTDPF